MRIGIVAGEASGDLLAAGLIRAIKQRYPQAQFEGIAGPAMIEAGCEARYPSERLAVMGLVEVLGRYRELSAMRKALARHFIDNPPDLFVGVDAPDFNLGLERMLKAQGIKTVHYVSPSVWAWRQYRVKRISRSVDLMLALFPFEARFYRDHDVAVEFVGHPLADMIPLRVDQSAKREALDLPRDKKLFALLPGSRMSEVKAIGGTMVEAARLIQQRHGESCFVAPLASPATRQAFEEICCRHDNSLDIRIIDGQARDVMAAADVVMVASGTATLEAMLLKRPMVVAYRMAPLTYWLASKLVKTPYVSLPNLLVGKKVVEELIQDAATPERLADEVLKFVDRDDVYQSIVTLFDEVHHQLRRDASQRAAEAVLRLIDAPAHPGPQSDARI